MTQLRLAAGVILSCSLPMASAVQAQEQCWQPHEVQAARVRDLQTMLMVGARECTAPDYDIAGHYDNFVAANRAALAGYNGILKVRFMREHGLQDGQRRYDNFAAALADQHTSFAQASKANFCAMAVSAMTMAANTTAVADLEMLATSLTERPLGIGADCLVSGDKSAVPVETATAAAIQSLPSSSQADPHSLQSTSTEVVVQPATSAPTPTAPQDPSAALHAAAAAVQSAAAALKASAAQASPAAQAASSPVQDSPASQMKPKIIQPESIVPPEDQDQ